VHRPPTFWSRLDGLIRSLTAEDAYTISELLVVMAILGTVVASVGTIFVSASRTEMDMNQRFRAQQEARLALDQLRREGHCASAVSTTANLVTFTFGSYCNRALDGGARAHLTTAMVTTSQTFLSASVFSGTFPTPPFTIQVDVEVMRVEAVSGSTWTVVRGQAGADGLPTTATTHAANTQVRLGPYRVTWCTSGSGSRWVLRRIPEATATCTAGKQTADHLTSGDVFTYTASGATRRATLGVSFVVDVDPADAKRVFRIDDGIVLRNTRRS
jgi:type II secretory pathway pseudopilin PulG